jgi:hypothetical protein
MAAQIPETAYERMTADERAKERLDRQKMLVSLPKRDLQESYLTFVAGLNVDVRENLEDMLLLVSTLPDGTAAALAAKTRVIQAARLTLEKVGRLHKISLVAAKDGADIAHRIFNPEPTFAEMDDEETKLLEKMRKEKEAAKKKEAADGGKAGWKGLAVKRTTPYSKGSYGGGYSNYGATATGLSNWALQQLLTQQLAAATSKKETGQGGSGQPPAAGTSGQQSGDYAARIALARVQYPCHNCGVMGHWKKDNQCKPADVAAHIRKRMAEQAEADREDGEDTGIIYIHSAIL